MSPPRSSPLKPLEDGTKTSRVWHSYNLAQDSAKVILVSCQ